jgi:nickel/cobalt transporter (NicO) family protein
MMNNSIAILSVTAISIGFVHTILGPDHYLPFIVMAQAKKWPLRRTMIITFLCGIGHVLSSVILGIVGIAIGISVTKLVSVESFRGNIAAWLFIAFGLVYMIISLRNLIRKKRHTHTHFHQDGEKHLHEHDHRNEHTHIHQQEGFQATPWVLFLIFVFGPCEPLIPLVMYPASKNNFHGAVIVAILFSVVTIATMMAIVMAFNLGLNKINLKPVEKYSHLIAGAMIFFSGLLILVLGL